MLLRDGQGRTIRFDVRADRVDPRWHARALRASPHGDEIEDVTVRVVDWDGLRRTCGPGAAGCYRRSGGRGLLVVPAGESAATRRTLVHEYDHHVDATQPHGGIREQNGTRHWWRVRGLERLVELGSVARSYRKGWSRSIAEIFAEDYAYLTLGGAYRIPWLGPPGAAVRRAIRADLGLGPAPGAVAAPPVLKPLVITRSGTLPPRADESVPFGLLGPGRTVVFTASLAGPRRAGSRALLTVECGSTVRRRTIGQALRAATIRLPSVGPASCTAALANAGATAERFRLTVRLSVRA